MVMPHSDFCIKVVLGEGCGSAGWGAVEVPLRSQRTRLHVDFETSLIPVYPGPPFDSELPHEQGQEIVSQKTQEAVGQEGL